MNIEGNELADKAAKKGIEQEINFNKVSLSYIKRKVKEKCLENWIKNWELNKKKTHYSQFEANPKWKPRLLELDKHTWSTICQLKLGHGYFKSFLGNLPAYDTKNCLSCQLKETPEHLLLSCQRYTKERKEVKKKHNIELVNMKFLFNTSMGLKFLIDFLKLTKIATRKWLLNTL